MLLAGPLAAQDERRLAEPADLHKDPDGTPLVTLPAGAAVETGDSEGDWRQVTVEGWIYQPSTSPTERDGFDLVVSSDEGENLRRTPQRADRRTRARRHPAGAGRREGEVVPGPARRLGAA